MKKTSAQVQVRKCRHLTASSNSISRVYDFSLPKHFIQKTILLPSFRFTNTRSILNLWYPYEIHEKSRIRFEKELEPC